MYTEEELLQCINHICKQELKILYVKVAPKILGKNAVYRKPIGFELETLHLLQNNINKVNITTIEEVNKLLKK